MTNQYSSLGIKGKAYKLMHQFLLVVMLHSTFVAPAQDIVIAYINLVPPLRYKDTILKDSELEKSPINKDNQTTSTITTNTLIVKTKPVKDSFEIDNFKEIMVIKSDISEGTIGVSKQNPLDDAKDNLFKFSINKLPQTGIKAYLSYDLYGVQDNTGVARSINNRLATGGYVIKQQNGWTSQKEEINPEWLQNGENKIMFSVPGNANFQYQIKDVKIILEKINSVSQPSLLALNHNLYHFTKDDKIYVKGFLRDSKRNNVKIYAEEELLTYRDGEFEGFLNLTKVVKDRNFIIVKAFDKKGVIGQEIINLDNLIEASQTIAIEDFSEKISKSFKSHTSDNMITEGASILVNERALNIDKILTIQKLRKIDLAPMASGMINVTKGGTGYRFLPDGTTFQKPISITLDYDEKLIPEGYSAKDINTFYFDTNSKSWVAVKKDTLLQNEKKIKSYTNHFTDYINGIIQTPESPETAAFTSTMMNDIKAADPASEMTIISPPEVSQKGDANVGYPIKIPSGRKGVQPSISVNYNSEGKNGWLGQGWGINTPSINIDSRWGVPLFDSAHESELYTMNGEQLMYPKIPVGNSYLDWMPNRHYEAAGNSNIYDTTPRDRIGNAVFTPRKQGSFSKIERLGNDTKTYYWKVTSTDGTINWYGGKDGVDSNAVIKNDAGDIVHWGLFMTEDVYGNNIKYYYSNTVLNGQSDQNENLNNSRVFHVNKITYTGFNGQDGNYAINFNKQNIIRNDVSIDSRLGVKLVEPYFLSNIIVRKANTNETIRKYVFDIGYGKFKKGQLKSITELDKDGNEFYTHKFDYYDDINVDGTDIYYENSTTEEYCFTDPVGGCDKHPDFDGDGIICNDLCPYQFGLGVNHGCPIDGDGDNGFPIDLPKTVNGDSSVKNQTKSKNYEQFFQNLKSSISSKEGFSTNKDAGLPCTVINDDSLISSYMPSFNSSAAILGSSKSQSKSAGFYIGLGIGSNRFTKMTTFGGQFNWSNDKSEGFTALIDINGDGLVDVVTKKHSGLYFKKHTKTITYDINNKPIVTHSFDEDKPVFGVDNFYHSYGSSKSANFQITFGLKKVGGFAGYDFSKNKSETDVYFTDGNGDGLMDIVKNGVVFFNRLDVNGNPTFIPDSRNTENLVITASPKENLIPTEFNQDEVTLPAFDVVKVWEAPSDGNIQIDNTIELTDTSKEAVVTIEKRKLEDRIYCGQFNSWSYPMTNIMYEYNIISAGSIFESSCGYYPAIINSLTINGGASQSPSTDYYFTHSNNGATTNMCPGSSSITLTPNYSIQNSNYPNEITPWFQSVLGSYLAPSTSINIFNSSYISRNPYESGTINDFYQVYGLGIKFNSFANFSNLDLKTRLWDPNAYNFISDSGNNNSNKKIISFNSTSSFAVKVNGVLIGTYDLINHPEVCEAAIENLYPGSNCTVNVSYDDAYHYLSENIDTNVHVSIYISNSHTLINTITINDIEIENTNPDCGQKQSTNFKIGKPYNTALTYNSNICSATADDLCLLYGTTLNLNNSIVSNTITQDSSNCGNNETLFVKKGERIYFRVHSITNGNAPINWNPQVQYVNSTLNATTDANGLTPFNSRYSDAFVLSSKNGTAFPGESGTASISWNSFSVTPTDDVTYEIVKKVIKAPQESSSDSDVITTEEVIYSKFCPANVTSVIDPDINSIPSVNLNAITVTNQAASPELSRLAQTFFEFNVTSTSNSDWANMDWKPKMICSRQEQVIGDTGQPEATVNSDQTLFPIANFSIYRLHPCGPVYNTIDVSQYGSNLTIKPDLTGVFSGSDTGKINFVVKRGNQFLGRRIFTITNGSLVVDNTTPISLNNNSAITTSSNVEISFTIDDSEVMNDNSLLKKIILNTNPSAIIEDALGNDIEIYSSNINFYQKTDFSFGSLYRQWGQFLYNPDAVTGALPSGIQDVNLIKEDSLQISQSQLDNIRQGAENIEANGDSMTEAQLQTFQSQYQGLINDISFFPCNVERNFENDYYERYTGLHVQNYASAVGYRAASLDQLFESFESFDPIIQQDAIKTGAYAINKYATGKSNNLSLGVSAFSIGVNGSWSNNAINKSLSDYVDYNGDRYPDIITTDFIQYTNKTGGLTPSRSSYGDVNNTEGDSSGFGATGSFGKSGDDGGDTKGKDFGFERFDGFRGNSGAGVSGNINSGNSIVKRTWSDMNGDGLSDLVTIDSYDNAQISLNNGYGFNSPYSNVNLPLFHNKSKGISGGIGVNMWQGSLEAGISITSNNNTSKNTILDINGDGLLDLISAESNIGVRLNAGNHFEDFGTWTSDYNLEKESKTASQSINVGASFALIWRIFGIPFKIPAINVNGTPYSSSTNRTYKTITDFDSDGYPDLVEEVNPTTVKVYSSRIRRTDLLKTVTNPLGGKFTVDYKVQKVDYNNPNPKWAMTGLTIDDGYDKSSDGRDKYIKEFVYENGRYDRRERDFYGYETVKVIDYNLDYNDKPTSAYRTSVSKYHNGSYFLNGLLKETYVIKGDDDNLKYTRTENIYEIKELDNTNNNLIFNSNLPHTFDVGGHEGRRTAAVVLTKTKNYLYELEATPLLTTEVSIVYDNKGRVVTYNNSGDINNPNDNYSSQITYHNQTSLTNANIISVPESIKVYAGSVLKRERSTLVNTTNGSIEQINAKIDNTNTAVTKLGYDNYGNLNEIIYPPNGVGSGDSMSYNYTYDTENYKYVIQTTDAFGYTSSAVYNALFDKVTETTDLAGNRMQYQYDSFGRNTIIRGPKEIDANIPYTIKFEYYPKLNDLSAVSSSITASNFTPVALTKHFDTLHPTNDIETYSFVDGLGRSIQVKKDIEINTATTDSPTYEEAMSYTGKANYDDFGRVVLQYHPYYEIKSLDTNFIFNENSPSFNNQLDYDTIDRVVKSTDADLNISTMEYSIEQDASGILGIKTKSIVEQNDSQQIITEMYKDINGKTISTKNVGPNGDIWTKFNYNAIGELMSYTDDENISTIYVYDLLGRKIEVNHPDNGITKYEYGDSGNLLKLQTANLANDNSLDPADRYIKYEYEYNRVIKIKYPDTPSGQNISNVTYTYGAQGAGNLTGRLKEQIDATGIQTFEYGNMGEITNNKRIVQGPNIPTRIFNTSYAYDSWNRLLQIIYPDNEGVNYSYDLGGNLNKMTGNVNGSDYDYIKRIDYDYYEQRTYLKYGNDTETKYNYTSSLRRLYNLNVKTSSLQNLFDNYYNFDKVGNILSINNETTPMTNSMGGSYHHTFTYDNLNRLSTAEGDFTGDQSAQLNGNDFQSDYTLKMNYNSVNGIVSKDQKHNKNNTGYAPNSFKNQYDYFGGTHKLKQVFDVNTNFTDTYNYDFNGNIISKINSNDGEKQFLWDESNRLRVVKDHKYMQHYIYDASGERVLKATADASEVYQNGTAVDQSQLTFNSYTTYPSGLIVIDPNGIYSKHYYAGSQRIISRIGEEDISFFDYNCTNCKKQTEGATLDFDALKQNQILDLQQRLTKAKLGKASFKKFEPISYQEATSMTEEEDEEIESKTNGNLQKVSTVMYYYHPDHLGTSTYLTDINGNAYQFFLNLPFGETMAEQRGTEYYHSPYKFNGKELDEETGLYYYGARYYDPRTSIWLSVDPLADKYPNWNPYNYTMQNPINLIDPTGMSSEDPGNPPIKNFYIVLDYDGTSSLDKTRETIEFRGLNAEGYQGIYARNLKDAFTQINGRIGDGQADNIILETHGNEGMIQTDNNTKSQIQTSDLKKSIDGVNTSNQSDVDALVGIVNKIKDGGNFLMNSCYTAKDDDFFNNLGTLTGNRISLFGVDCKVGPDIYESPKGHSIYEAKYLLNEKSDFIIRLDNLPYHVKQYRTHCDGEAPLNFYGIRATKNGIIGF